MYRHYIKWTYVDGPETLTFFEGYVFSKSSIVANNYEKICTLLTDDNFLGITWHHYDADFDFEHIFYFGSKEEDRWVDGSQVGNIIHFWNDDDEVWCSYYYEDGVFYEDRDPLQGEQINDTVTEITNEKLYKHVLTMNVTYKDEGDTEIIKLLVQTNRPTPYDPEQINELKDDLFNSYIVPKYLTLDSASNPANPGLIQNMVTGLVFGKINSNYYLANDQFMVPIIMNDNTLDDSFEYNQGEYLAWGKDFSTEFTTITCSDEIVEEYIPEWPSNDNSEGE